MEKDPRTIEALSTLNKSQKLAVNKIISFAVIEGIEEGIKGVRDSGGDVDKFGIYNRHAMAYLKIREQYKL